MPFPGAKGTACSAGGDWRAAGLRAKARVRHQGFGEKVGPRKRPLEQAAESLGGRAPAGGAHLRPWHTTCGSECGRSLTRRSTAHLCGQGAADPRSLVLAVPLLSTANSTCRALPMELWVQLFLRTLNF